MGEETDPRALALAAGESGGKQGFMTTSLSNRAAKDYSKALASIEDTTRMGGWAAMIDMAQKFADMLGILEPYKAIFELISEMTQGATAETTAKIYNDLFSDENIQQLQDTANAIGMVFAAIYDGWKTFEDGVHDFEVMVDHFDEVTMPKVRQDFEDWIIAFDALGFQLGENLVKSIQKGFIDAMNSINWKKIIKDIIEDHLGD